MEKHNCLMEAFSNQVLSGTARRALRAMVLPSLHDIRQQTARGLVSFARNWMPTEIIVSAPRSDWCNGKPRPCAEFVSILGSLRAGHAGRIVLQSNSDAAVGRYGPEWSQACEQAIKDLGIEIHSGIYAISKGWLSVCATDASDRHYPGSTAHKLAARLGCSIVCSGTGELSLIERTSVARDHRVWAVETGSLKARSSGRWASSTGFFILETDGQSSRPATVSATNANRFEIDPF